MKQIPSSDPVSAQPFRTRAVTRFLTGLAWVTGMGVVLYSTIFYVYPGFAYRSEPAFGPAAVQPRLWLVLHAGGGAVALLAGLVQLTRKARDRWHRLVGRLYVYSVMASGVAGLVLAGRASSGLFASGGFAVLALLWLWHTLTGVRFARAGRAAEHGRAMYLSLALTAAAISLRVQLPLAQVFDIPFSTSYPWIAWSCWLPQYVALRLAFGKA